MKLTSTWHLLFSCCIAAAFYSCKGSNDQSTKKDVQKSSDYTITGSQSQDQGLFLSLPDLSQEDFRYISVEIYGSGVPMSDASEECRPGTMDLPPAQEGTAENVDHSGDRALADAQVVNGHDSTSDRSNQTYLAFKMKYGEQGRQVKLPPDTYRIRMMVYNDKRMITYKGMSSVIVQSQNYAHAVIDLKRVQNNCREDGVLVIDYRIEDNPNEDIKIDVCKYVESLPVPSCIPESAYASCYLPPFKENAGMTGRRTCIGGAKYALLKDVCNAKKYAYMKQIDQIVCESEAMPPQKQPEPKKPKVPETPTTEENPK